MGSASVYATTAFGVTRARLTGAARQRTDSLSGMTTAIDLRRSRTATAWALTDELVLVAAGEPIAIPGGADQTYPFLAHPEYLWLTGHAHIGAVLAFDARSGWVDFVPPVTEAERVWEGHAERGGTPIAELAAWLAARRGRPVVVLGAGLPGVRGDAARAEALRIALLHARRPKDALELELMRAAAAATAVGYARAVPIMRPGVTERGVRIALETGFAEGGGDGVGYDTIVGFGSDAAVLHFAPTSRVLAAGEPILIDAGASVRRYIADVTRTYRAGGPEDGFFRDLYSLVLAVEERAIAGCVAGAEWRDLHMAAARQILEGLIALGFLRGAADALLERDVHALFFPHGLGHMVGLGVRDASGYLPGRVRSTRPGLSALRTDLPLEPGYTITVEPGIYFIRALLTDPVRRERYADCVVWDRVDARLDWGGIRVEDDVLITTSAPEVLTRAIPKSLEAVTLPS